MNFQMAQVENFSEINLSAKFSSLTAELLSLSYGRVSDKKSMDSCLNKLISLDYRFIEITNANSVLLLIHQLCTNIQPAECRLVKSYSQFIVHIIRAGANITGRTFTLCEKWFAGALEYCEDDVKNDVLSALQSLLRNGPFDIINQNLRSLLGENGVLCKLIRAPDDKWTELNFLALSCIEAILANSENNAATISLEYRRMIKEIVLNILYSLTYDTLDKLLYNKTVCCCLRILCKLTADKSSMNEDPDSVGQILGVVKSFLFHGIKGYSSMKPHRLRPAAMNLPEIVHARGGNARKKTRAKKQTPKKSSPDEKTNENVVNGHEILPNCCKYSSDSDTESFNPVQAESKVRLEAIHLLHAAMQDIPARDMFGYWSQIVASGSRDSARVLTRSILKEPVAKVRRSVLGTLSKLLANAKFFLAHADDSEHPSFLTFFGTVGAMIRELHLTLSLVLSYERNPTVLIHALKCAGGLVQGTPYARLKPGLATKLSRNCSSHILHRDPTVRVSVLSVFEAFALLDPLTPEVVGILEKRWKILDNKDFPELSRSATSGGDDEDREEASEYEFMDLSYDECEFDSEIEDEASREKSVSSLLQVCLKYISNEEEKGPVRLHALKVLNALACNVEGIVFAHLEPVTTTIAKAARESDVQVARHACRVIETVAGRLANSRPEDVNIVMFWNIVLSPVTSLVQHSQTTLREATCDCLGNIGSSMFSQLPRDQSILIITILFGAVRDEESAVRAAAVRALGMLVGLPSLEEDTGFLMDLADIVCLAMNDRNLGVRVKACWTLANLCDCLIRRKNNDEIEPAPLDTLLPRLYSATVKAAEDNCKVKCNAMRAVGSVLRLCSDEKALQDASGGLEALIKCATLENDMKVRWNACRALGFVMSYKPDAILPSSWRDQVFPTLCNLICHSPNFKVRTNAAWALSACESYDKFVPFLWKSVVVGLENSQHVPSFVEYPHRDALVEQLCLTLSHLAARTYTSDLQSVWIEVDNHFDDISNHMKHLHNRVLPEKAKDLVEAKTHLQRLMQTATNSEDKLVAKNLANLFERTNLYDDIGQLGNKHF